MTKIYPIKTFIVIVVRENQFQITLNTLDNNHPIIRMIEEDHHTKEIHKNSRKTDLVDHIVEIVNIEITTQDQIQTNLNFRLMPVPIQILEVEIIHLETLHSIDIEIIPTKGIETILIIETLDIKTTITRLF